MERRAVHRSKVIDPVQKMDPGSLPPAGLFALHLQVCIKWERLGSGTFWRISSFTLRARFMPVLCEKTLPWSLWLSSELEERDRLLAVLQFLRPITTAAASDPGRLLSHVCDSRPLTGYRLKHQTNPCRYVMFAMPLMSRSQCILTTIESSWRSFLKKCIGIVSTGTSTNANNA